MTDRPTSPHSAGDSDRNLAGAAREAVWRERTTVLAPEPALLTNLRRLGFMTGVVAVLSAIGVLVGWATGSDVLVTFDPDNNRMSALTAVGLLALGVAVCLVNTDRTRHRVAVTGLLLLPVILVCMWAIGAELLGLPAGPLTNGFGLQPLFPDGLPDLRQQPTPVASILLLCLAAGLLFAQVGWARTGQTLMFVGTAISLLALQGYLMGLPGLYDWGGQHPMALKTAAHGLLIAVGAMVAEAGKGFVALVTSNSAGGRVARRLFPLVVSVPMLLATACVWQVNRGDLTGREALAWFSVVATIITGMVVWWLSVSLRGVDVDRASAAAEAGEFRRLLAERDALAHDLSRANDDLEAFAAIAAHDLRSPLVAIRGYAELLYDDPSLVNNGGHRWLEKIMSGADRGAVLVQELLAYSQASTLRQPLQPVDLTLIARAVVAECSHPEAVRVRPMAGVMGDELLLHQLLTNLIENALKYLPAGRDPEVLVDAIVDGDAVTVRVSDNGDGIPVSDRERLLGMFERGTHPVEGSGIGLAICQRVAERHGGRLWIEDSDLGGARLCVLLRAAGPRNPRPQVSAGGPRPA